MTDPKLGTPISNPEAAQRDAIHVAVVPVTSEETLSPGEHVGLVDAATNKVSRNAKKIGVVDPFMTAKKVSPGSTFWLVLYPGTITGLRHEWAHPAWGDIPGEVTPSPRSVAASRAWIEAFADELDQTYRRLMSAAGLWEGDEDYTNDTEEVYKGVDDDKWPVFWKHYEVVTGRKVSAPHESFFTCSC